MAKAATNGGDSGDAPAPNETPTCGIVMPISAIDDCPATHWVDVLEVVREAAEAAGFTARMVSAADYSGIILGEIVGNLYSDPIVVCDVSTRNPNVMFELGMRLAFDKPTIVIKDDKTDYAFDTQAIEHLAYPRDLRYQTIVLFKQSLAAKIKATHERAAQNDYKSFLKHFGTFTVATVETKEVSPQEFIMNELKDLKAMVQNMSVRRTIRQLETDWAVPAITANTERIQAEEARRMRRAMALSLAAAQRDTLRVRIGNPGDDPEKVAEVKKFITDLPQVKLTPVDKDSVDIMMRGTTSNFRSIQHHVMRRIQDISEKTGVSVYFESDQVS